jgi:glutamyl/glutaminyl-tRNA synthetase
MKAVNSPK